VTDEDAEILDATELWGIDTGECQARIRDKHDDDLIKVASIGKGGENLVRYACVINDNRDAAGRTGTGAIMGSKRLKAIAVRGKGKTPVEDSERLRELATGFAKSITERRDSSGEYGGARRLHDYGTGSTMVEGMETGNLPTNNFRDALFEGVTEISAQAVEEKYRTGIEACYACAVRCKKAVEVDKEDLKVDPLWEWFGIHFFVFVEVDKEDLKVDPSYGGPEYETLAALGSNCGIDQLDYICKGNELCNRYSIDTIGAGMSISFAMECYEEGIITEEDTGGLDLSWGNAESMIRLIEMIGARRGIGDLLAEGVMKASKRIGEEAEQYAIHVKRAGIPDA